MRAGEAVQTVVRMAAAHRGKPKPLRPLKVVEKVDATPRAMRC